MLDKHIRVFVVHISFLSLQSKMTIYPTREDQITFLLVEKVIILAKYLDCPKIFLKVLAKVLLEKTGANEHTIKLEQNKQPLYRPIYILELIKLEIYKTYIKTNLVNSFIKVLKSLADTLILFVCKLDGNFRLYVNF